jgi:hypothetical protein
MPPTRSPTWAPSEPLRWAASGWRTCRRLFAGACRNIPAGHEGGTDLDSIQGVSSESTLEPTPASGFRNTRSSQGAAEASGWVGSDSLVHRFPGEEMTLRDRSETTCRGASTLSFFRFTSLSPARRPRSTIRRICRKAVSPSRGQLAVGCRLSFGFPEVVSAARNPCQTSADVGSDDHAQHGRTFDRAVSFVEKGSQTPDPVPRLCLLPLRTLAVMTKPLHPHLECLP